MKLILNITNQSFFSFDTFSGSTFGLYDICFSLILDVLSPLVRESGFWNLGNYFLLVESGIVGLGIWNTAQGIWIPLTIGIRNPSSTDTDSGIKNLESGIHSMGSRI